MGLKTQTSVIHLSWEEVYEMTLNLADQMRANPPKSICGLNRVDEPIAAMLAYTLDIPVDKNGEKFTISNGMGMPYCFYIQNWNSEHFNRTCKASLYTLEEENEQFTKITVPWQK